MKYIGQAAARPVRRLLAGLLVAALLLAPGILPAASAAHVTADQAVDTLSALGLFKGTATGYALDRAVTREEAVTLLVRLLGGEQDALAQCAASPFSDVSGWAAPYVAWGYSSALVHGASETVLNAHVDATAQEFIAFTLRALGYSEAAGDFTYANALAFAEEIGLTHGEYLTGEPAFLREDAALVMYTALTLDLADGSCKLVEKLLGDGVFAAGDLLGTRLARYANSGKREYSAAEIYERTSSAVFLVESYASEEAREKQEPAGTASGFFISADGLALMSYHELEGMRSARITTTDGRSYELDQIVYYDGYRDIALVRIDRTSLDGRTVRAFPYIDLGNPAAMGIGDRVYTMSCPIGLADCLSDGLVSGVGRVADDAEYPFVQFTAPISQGSSGGVLLNSYGEAIGVIMGAFNKGYSLNLAVPVDCLKDVDFTAQAQSLITVYETEQAKNAASTLTASQTEVTLKMGETAEILITRDCPGSVSLQYFCSDNTVLACRWGTFTSKTTVPLYITANAHGSATVTVTYADGYGNPEASVEITVNVPATLA